MRTALDSSFQKIRLPELYGRNIGANLLGLLIIILLNLFTPVEFFKAQRAFLLAGGWMVILSFYPVVIFIGIGLAVGGHRAVAAGDPVWPTFCVWVLPALAVAAAGEALWLGYYRISEASDVPE